MLSLFNPSKPLFYYITVSYRVSHLYFTHRQGSLAYPTYPNPIFFLHLFKIFLLFIPYSQKGGGQGQDPLYLQKIVLPVIVSPPCIFSRVFSSNTFVNALSFDVKSTVSMSTNPCMSRSLLPL